MYDRDKLYRAKQRVAQITVFYLHATAYLLVMSLMFVINAAASPEWWVHWPLLCWGLGLMVHASAIFGAMPRFVERWQVRKIKELVEQM